MEQLMSIVRIIACAAPLFAFTITAPAAQTGGDAAAAGRSAGEISQGGGVNAGSGGDLRHSQRNEDAGPQTGTSGKNADNNTPLTGPKRRAADRDPDTGKAERK
jgi:hypothetical protein